MKRMLFTVVLSVLILLVLPPGSARGDALDNWTPSQVVTDGFGPNGPQLLGVAYGSGRYVAVGQYTSTDYAVVQTSDDGNNWTRRDPSSVYDLLDVTYGNSMFVAVGWDGFGGQNIYNSTNGINWTPHNTAIVNLYRAVFDNGLFVAVGDGETLQGSGRTNRQIYTSPNGTTWTGRISGSPAGDVARLRDVAYGAGLFVAVDDGGYVHTSTTGTSGWTRSQVGGSPALYSYGYVNFCNGRFIALFNSGTNFVSPNGSSWSPMVKDTTNALSRVIYAGGVYVALGGSDPAYTNILTSSNGTNWVLRNLQVPTNTILTALVFANGKVMAAGYQLFPSSLYHTLPLAYVSDPLAGVSIDPGFPPQLKISGLLNRSYRIEYVNGLQSSTNNWQPLATISLTNSPYSWSDTTATNSQRHYRTVLLP